MVHDAVCPCSCQSKLKALRPWQLVFNLRQEQSDGLQDRDGFYYNKKKFKKRTKNILFSSSSYSTIMVWRRDAVVGFDVEFCV